MKLYPFSMLALVMVSSCQVTPVAPAADVSKAPLSGEACPNDDEGAYLFWFENPSREVGEAVQLQPYFSTYPGHMDELPAGCIGEMTASPEAAAEFERDELGGVLVRLTDKATPGTNIMISANYGGHKEISGMIDVYDPEANPLVGRWAQSEDTGCASASIIRELIFKGDGSFSVTWMPFEVYKDYWGDFEYDVGTGRLSLTPDGGNYIPDDVSAGVVRLSGDTLTLAEGMSFGSTRAEETCSAPFKRR